MSLLGTDNVLANCQLGELCERVYNYGHADILTFAKKTELGTSKTRLTNIISKDEII